MCGWSEQEEKANNLKSSLGSRTLAVVVWAFIFDSSNLCLALERERKRERWMDREIERVGGYVHDKKVKIKPRETRRFAVVTANVHVSAF